MRATLYLPSGEERQLTDAELHRLNPYQDGDQILYDLDVACDCMGGRTDTLAMTEQFIVLSLCHGPELFDAEPNPTAGRLLTALTHFDWLASGGVYGPILLIELVLCLPPVLLPA